MVPGLRIYLQDRSPQSIRLGQRAGHRRPEKPSCWASGFRVIRSWCSRLVFSVPPTATSESVAVPMGAAPFALAPQEDWAANQAGQLGKGTGCLLGRLTRLSNGCAFSNKRVSLADLIVLGGSAAVERKPRRMLGPFESKYPSARPHR